MPGQSLFVYGTLMHPPVFEAVAGRPPGVMIPARLAGFRRSRIQGLTYPGIVPEEGSFTEGLLIEVDATALTLLDAFEGTQYERMTVGVECEDGQKIRADVYVLEENSRRLITREPWELEKFLAGDLHSFLNG